MKKALRIESPLSIHHFYSYALDLLVMVVAVISLYFIILYSVFGFTSFNYVQNNEEIGLVEDSYDLNLEEGLEYREYRAVIERFYFNEYKEEIVNEYNSYHETNFTIEHIFNVVVLDLPQNPTYENYSTDYFAYFQNEDGSYDPNKIGYLKEGSGAYYERNLRDLFYNAYTDLKTLLYNYNETYSSLIDTNNNYELISRISSFVICFSVFHLIIPFTNKNRLTIFERVFKIARVNVRNGYLIPWWKVIFRGVVYYILPIFSVIFFSSTSFIILTLGTFLINSLCIIFGKNNKDLSDRILRIEPCDIEMSLIFKTKNEEVAFEKEEASKYSGEEFVDKIKNIE